MLKDTLKEFFIPKYDELSLFVMSASILILLAIDETCRQELSGLLIGQPKITFASVFWAAGIVLSIYHVFTRRKKSHAEKGFMLFFAVMTNIMIGLYLGFRQLKEPGILILFPLWNLFNAFMLMLLFRLRMIKDDSIGDEDASPLETVTGAAMAILIIGVCLYALRLNWAMTFSICLVYATSVGRTTREVAEFIGKMRLV